jgi:excisionase family DNA binding protein
MGGFSLMNHVDAGLEPATDLLSIADLMRLSRESESCWRKRLGRHELPYLRLGANVRVRRADLEAWLAARTIPAVREAHK